MSKGIWGQITSRVPAPRPGTPLWEPWKAVTRLNTALYRRSGGRIGGRFDDAPVLILHHRGRRSGTLRQTPLVHLPDGGERWVIVASFGGNPHNPAWVHNLRAAPETEIEVGGRRVAVRAHEADGDERADLWPRLLVIWPAWADYQRRTKRRFPVFVLEPR